MTQGSRGAYILYIYTQQGVNIHKVYSRFVSQQLYTRSVVKYSNGLTLYALVGLCKMDLVLHITIRTPD